MGTGWSSLADEESEGVRDMLAGSRRRVNVLVVGPPYSGKSSLIASLETCITHTHTPSSAPESFGQLRNDGSFVFHVSRRPAFEERPDMAGAAVLFDMPGIPEEPNERTRAILSAVIGGFVRVNTNIHIEAEHTADDVRRLFSESSKENRIDRVVFVQSCKVEISHAVDSVLDICRAFDVTLFGVLTHVDQRRVQFVIALYRLFNRDVGVNLSLDDLAKAVGFHGSPRGCEAELYRGVTSREFYKTNYFLALLWKCLLNNNYTIHSEFDNTQFA